MSLLMLLAPELLAIALRSGPAASELDPVDTTSGPISGKPYDYVRASGTALGVAALRRVRAAVTRM